MAESLNTVTALLRELCELLEQYAPSWYTPEHHQRAQSALRWLADNEAKAVVRGAGE